MLGDSGGIQLFSINRQPIQLASVTKLSKVNYRGIEIMGEGPNWVFARQPDTELIEQLLCDSGKSPHPSCRTLDVEEGCRNAINNNIVKDIISKCNFTKNPYPEPFHKVADGGILILQAAATVKPTPVYHLLASNNRPHFRRGGIPYHPLKAN